MSLFWNSDTQLQYNIKIRFVTLFFLIHRQMDLYFMDRNKWTKFNGAK
jgi:hypothetical protein